MIAIITPSAIKGIISVPASKSAMQRACALALLNKGETIIHNPGNSNDDLTAINIIKALGADVRFADEGLVVKSNGKVKTNKIINCEESGLSLRMFAPIAALDAAAVLLNGTGSLVKRSMHFIDEVFPLLNVKTLSNNGYLPIRITGPLLPKNISIDGSTSSQYLTGLLFALAKAAREPITIHVSNLKSKPYIDLSLQMLRYFGYDVSHDEYKIFYIKPVIEQEKNISYHTEADWSSASLLLVAGAIAGTVSLRGLDMLSSQADKAIINVLGNCNADIEIDTGTVSVTNKNVLRNFEFDATDCPDLFPPLAVLASFCNGTSVIKGISRLSGKESNRGATLLEVFTKMGVKISVKEDSMIITGDKTVQAATVSSHHDHRIAMACAIAGLKASGDMIIHDAAAVNKSYPDFYEHLKMLGALVSLSQ